MLELTTYSAERAHLMLKVLAQLQLLPTEMDLADGIYNAWKYAEKYECLMKSRSTNIPNTPITDGATT